MSLVDSGFENLQSLTRSLGAGKSPNEFFTLSTEHGAANDFNPAESTFGKIHLLRSSLIGFNRLFGPKPNWLGRILVREMIVNHRSWRRRARCILESIP